jgi:hypothetical protein
MEASSIGSLSASGSKYSSSPLAFRQDMRNEFSGGAAVNTKAMFSQKVVKPRGEFGILLFSSPLLNLRYE